MRRTSKSTLTHIDPSGAARMVDVGGKPIMQREAVAEGFLIAAPATLDRLMKKGGSDLPKGDALSTARIAGIAAAKKCDELIPLCHTLPLDSINVDFARAMKDRVRITAIARIAAKTGVEMEALVAVSVAALTLYDMTKAIDKGMRIGDIRLVRKTKR